MSCEAVDLPRRKLGRNEKEAGPPRKEYLFSESPIVGREEDASETHGL